VLKLSVVHAALLLLDKFKVAVGTVLHWNVCCSVQ